MVCLVEGTSENGCVSQEELARSPRQQVSRPCHWRHAPRKQVSRLLAIFNGGTHPFSPLQMAEQLSRHHNLQDPLRKQTPIVKSLKIDPHWKIVFKTNPLQ